MSTSSERSSQMPVRHMVCIALCALTAVMYLQRIALSPVEISFREELGLDKDQMGWIQGLFFFPYALLQVPFGLLVQRWGSRNVLFALCLVGSLACGACGWSTGFWSLLWSRMILGAAQAGVVPAIAAVLSVWCVTQRRTSASGWITAFMQLGAILAAFGTPWLVTQTGLAVAFQWLMLPGILWAIAFIWWYCDDPAEHSWVSPSERDLLAASAPPVGDTQNKEPWWPLITQPAFLCLCGQQFFRAGGYAFFTTWFSTFMQETRGVDLKSGGVLMAYSLGAAFAGALAGGWLPDLLAGARGDIMAIRKWLSIFTQFGCAACIGLAATSPSLEWSIIWFCAGAFLTSCAGPAAYAATIDLAGKNVAPIFGVMNMSGNFGAAAFPILVPKLLGPQRDNWNGVMITFSLIFVVAGAFWWGVRKPAGSQSGPETAPV